jgi:riboflavin-specific deaminase-like protein
LGLASDQQNAFLRPKVLTPKVPMMAQLRPDRPDTCPDPFLDPWAAFTEAFRGSDGPLPEPWGEIFGPLRTGTTDDMVVVGQIGQSLDGRIATISGDSHYINGPAGLTHLHRLRALVDAVVVGVGTAVADDPQLTVRRVSGPQPARVVIDPKARLAANARIFSADGVRRLVVTAQGVDRVFPPGVEVVALPLTDHYIAPRTILAALADRGFRRVLIEGGAETVSRFFDGGCLDRLHVIVAPVILGSGRPSFNLRPIERASEALRLPARLHRLEDESLFDCDLSSQRRPIGLAKKST